MRRDSAFLSHYEDHRIDIDIIFGVENRNLRADIDNVAKLILDGLKCIVYEDDRQVRSVGVVALPGDDLVRVIRLRGSITEHLQLRDGREFLVKVYDSLPVDLT